MDELKQFEDYLRQEEKSPLTIEKYIRDVRGFLLRLGGKALEKGQTLEYKAQLMEQYCVSSVNSMLSSLNSYLDYIGRTDCKVKLVRQQRQVFCEAQQELSRKEYSRLLQAANKNTRLRLLMQTICSTGIRVSEHRFITVEAAKTGCAKVRLKGKIRTILLPGALCKALLKYALECRISSGSIFVTADGKPLNRSCIWRQMKNLCDKAGVGKSKVFPHNLRKLFARTFYALEKDIAKLADILGHSSINTTRIYIISTGREHRRKIERLGLVE